MGLEGIVEVVTDPERRFVSFKGTPSNDRVLCLCPFSVQHQRTAGLGGRFFERLKSYMQNKNEGNESKTIIGDLNYTVDKIDWDGENKTQTLQVIFQLCPVKTHRG